MLCLAIDGGCTEAVFPLTNARQANKDMEATKRETAKESSSF